jgi:hypothetical protein
VETSFALALSFNFVVSISMYAYLGKASIVVTKYETGINVCNQFPLGGGRETDYGREKVDIAAQPRSPSLHQAIHQHGRSAAYGHKWARKVD